MVDDAFCGLTSRSISNSSCVKTRSLRLAMGNVPGNPRHPCPYRCAGKRGRPRQYPSLRPILEIEELQWHQTYIGRCGISSTLFALPSAALRRRIMTMIAADAPTMTTPRATSQPIAFSELKRPRFWRSYILYPVLSGGQSDECLRFECLTTGCPKDILRC